jgi:D-inositol-3-phosphate glycosyltransferase
MVSMHTSPIDPAGSADAGGMNVAILATAAELASRGVEVDLVTRATDAAGVRLIAPGITLHSLPAGPRRQLPKGELMHHADEFGEQLAELTRRAAGGYDVIHAHYWLSGLAALPVAIELGIPLVQSFHTLGAMKNAHLAAGDRPEPARRLHVEAYLADQADAVIAGSAAEVSALMDDIRADGSRLWVIPPGVDTMHFTPSRRDAASATRARLGLPAARPIVAVVGRIQPLKGQELAIRAVAELDAERPVLALAGDATADAAGYLAELRALVTRRGLQADVRFLGTLSRTDTADLLAASALTLVPSHSETFGLVALESAASGTPVLAARGSGLDDSIADGESGILLDSRDPGDWAAAIRGLLGNPGRIAALSRSALPWAARFTWGTAAASALGVYASLLRKPVR